MRMRQQIRQDLRIVRIVHTDCKCQPFDRIEQRDVFAFEQQQRSGQHQEQHADSGDACDMQSALRFSLFFPCAVTGRDHEQADDQRGGGQNDRNADAQSQPEDSAEDHAETAQSADSRIQAAHRIFFHPFHLRFSHFRLRSQ